MFCIGGSKGQSVQFTKRVVSTECANNNEDKKLFNARFNNLQLHSSARSNMHIVQLQPFPHIDYQALPLIMIMIKIQGKARTPQSIQVCWRSLSVKLGLTVSYFSLCLHSASFKGSITYLVNLCVQKIQHLGHVLR